MPRYRSTVRTRFPAPDDGDLIGGSDGRLKRSRRDSKSVMPRIANPVRPVRLWFAPPRQLQALQAIDLQGFVFQKLCLGSAAQKVIIGTAKLGGFRRLLKKF